MQIRRLFEIVYLLLEKGTVTAKSLSERLEVSVRTVYRDIETLSEAGIPVYMSSGRNGGISLLPGFVLNKTVLSQSEKDEILSALHALSAAQNSVSNEVLSKLGALFGDYGESWVEVDFYGWGWSRDSRESFSLIKDAIIERKVISFLYFGGSGPGEERIVEPLKLVFRGQAWYLFAYCRKRAATRFFKLARIENIRTLDERFIRTSSCSGTEYNTQKLVTEEIIFKADAKMSPRIFDEFSHRSISVNEDGSLIVKVDFPVGDWLSGYFLSFGESVEVLSPQWLRNEITEKIKLMKEKYKI